MKIILKLRYNVSVRQHNHFITEGNYTATCFDYRLVILRPILSIVSQDAMHTLGSHRVSFHRIHQIKSFVSKDVTFKLPWQFARDCTDIHHLILYLNSKFIFILTFNSGCLN